MLLLFCSKICDQVDQEYRDLTLLTNAEKGMKNMLGSCLTSRLELGETIDKLELTGLFVLLAASDEGRIC